MINKFLYTLLFLLLFSCDGNKSNGNQPDSNKGQEQAASHDSNLEEVNYLDENTIIQEELIVKVDCSDKSIAGLINCSKETVETFAEFQLLSIIRDYLNVKYRITSFSDFRYFFLDGLELLNNNEIQDSKNRLQEYLSNVNSINKEKIKDLESKTNEKINLKQIKSSNSIIISNILLNLYNNPEMINQAVEELKQNDTTPDIFDLYDNIIFSLKKNFNLRDKAPLANSVASFKLSGLDMFNDNNSYYFLSSQLESVAEFKSSNCFDIIKKIDLNDESRVEFLPDIKSLLGLFEYDLLANRHFNDKLFKILLVFKNNFLIDYPKSEYGNYDSFENWFKYYSSLNANKNYFAIEPLNNEIKFNKIKVKIKKLLSSSPDSVSYYAFANNLLNNVFFKSIPKKTTKYSWLLEHKDDELKPFFDYPLNSGFEHNYSILNRSAWIMYNLLNPEAYHIISGFIDYEYGYDKKDVKIVYPLLESFKLFQLLSAGTGASS